MATNDLSAEEVCTLLDSYEESAVTDELYEFGKMLLEEIQDRANKLTSQSTMVLGWSSGFCPPGMAPDKDIRSRLKRGHCLFCDSAYRGPAKVVAVPLSRGERRLEVNRELASHC